MQVYKSKTPQPETQTQVANTPAPLIPENATPGPAAADTSVSAPSANTVPLAPATDEQLTLNLPQAKIHFSRDGGCLGNIFLTDFKQDAQKKDAGPAKLFLNYTLCKALGMRVGGIDFRTLPVAVTRNADREITLTQRSGDFELVRTFKFSEKPKEIYNADLSVELKNVGSAQQNTNLGIELGATSEHKDAGGIFNGIMPEQQEILYHFDDDVEREHLGYDSAPTREEIFRKNSLIPDWVASNSHYFLLALLPQNREAVDLSILRTGFNIQQNAQSPADRTVYEAWIDSPTVLAPNTAKAFQYKIYYGPKLKANLEKFGDKHLERSINYGIFQIVAWPMYYATNWLNKLLGNWGLAIIVLTLAIKILFYPLTAKAFVAGKKMQKLQPELNALKEKFKDDKAAQQKEMMGLMSSRGVNPMSGCLPILPQIPVFFGLNAILTHTYELRHAPFYLWIQDLSARDPYFISPVIMAVLMYLQQKMTPLPSMDPAQARMMQILPLVFAVFMLSYPSGMVLYIITNSVVSMLQQSYMMRKHAHLM